MILLLEKVKPAAKDAKAPTKDKDGKEIKQPEVQFNKD